MLLPLLYKKTKTNATQTYQVSVLEDTYTVTQGQLEGKKQSYTTKCTPKNIERSNATTGPQQAILEAQAKHTKKIKAGYSTNKTAPITKLLPMKIKVYQDHKAKVKFPAIAQPKLDGVNALIRLLPDNSIQIISRGGETYPPIPHLEAQLRSVFHTANTNTLAGELYIHGEYLQDIQSAVKKPKPLSKQLTFRLFDLPNVSGDYITRTSTLRTSACYFKQVKPIPSVEVLSHEDIELIHKNAIEDGYEGAVIYNHDAPYEYNVRSSHIWKYKIPKSKEFLITGYNYDKNNHPVFILDSAGGEFKAKPIGTVEFKNSIDPDTYIGKHITVEFETYSKPKPGLAVGIPLKPVAIALREVDASGQPLE